MSPTLINGSSAQQCFECSNAIKIQNGQFLPGTTIPLALYVYMHRSNSVSKLTIQKLNIIILHQIDAGTF